MIIIARLHHDIILYDASMLMLMLVTPSEQPGRGVEAAVHHEVPGAQQPRGLPRPPVPRRAPRTQHREHQQAGI